MPDVTWVNPVMMHATPCGRRKPVLTLDQLEAWLEEKKAQAKAMSELHHRECVYTQARLWDGELDSIVKLLAQVQAWRDGK